MKKAIKVPPLWGVYAIDPSDGELGWCSMPQIPGEPTLAFSSESDFELTSNSYAAKGVSDDFRYE